MSPVLSRQPLPPALAFAATAACLFFPLSAIHAAGEKPVADDLQSQFTTRVQPLLETYCLDCHDRDTKKGDLDLTAFGSLANVQADFKTWQVVLQQIEEEEMPPKKPLPSAAERAALAEWVRGALDGIDWSKHRGISHITLPRLTKQEYNNTLRDLLGVDMQPGAQLLDDGQGLSGFTNDRDALFISPALAEQYFDAADYALQAVLNLGGKSMNKQYEAESMLMTERGAKPEILPGNGGTGYSLAGGGQRTLYDEITVPADGWYRLTVRAVGRGGDSGMRLRIDNETRADFYNVEDKPEEQVVELLLRAGSHQMTWNIELPRSLQKARQEARPPLGATQRRAARAKATPLPANAAEITGAAVPNTSPRMPVPEGATREVAALVQRLNQTYAGMQRRIEYLRLITPDGGAAQLKTYYNLLPERTAVMAKVKADLAAEMKVPMEEIDRRLLEASGDRLASNQKVLKDSLEVIGVDYHPGFLLGHAPPVAPVRVGTPGVDWIRIEGPVLPQGSQPETVVALFQPDARAALRDFLPRAFRRPLRVGELKRHLTLYDQAKARGENHDQALKLAFTAALTSPNFLFRDELAPEAAPAGAADAAFVLNDHALASRLSYFLWMTQPDAELRRLADAGQLANDTALRAQVKRLLADPKARAFTSTFLGQWLDFAGLGSEHVPDARKFRDFTPGLAEAMKLEPVLVFENLLRTGGSLLKLLDGQETFANAELAELYEIPGIQGADMRPVQQADDRRGGLLGMAATLTASATPNRTSPVLRGKWVMENLLGRHLAEPPADAGQLDDQAGNRGKTLREELAEHRRSESCAGCHDKIDPIGFGLENFDAIGRFRETEAGRPVDATGQLPGGATFTGPAELRALLMKRHQDEFMTNLTRRLTAFALGRALQPQDEGLVRLLLTDLKKTGHRADALIESIVLSQAFRTQPPAQK